MRQRIYFNLRKHLFSIKDWTPGSEDYGTVVEHTEAFMLTNVTFVVSEAGRQRVLREKVKNVHAYVQGETGVPQPKGNVYQLVEVSYNPYRGPSFYRKDTGEDIKHAFAVLGGVREDGRPVLWATVELD